MTKAIAVQAIFLIAVIAIFLFFIAAIFWSWIGTTKLGTSQATCTAKVISYCSDWARTGDEPKWWDTKEPTDCARSDIGINKPTCQECEERTGRKLCK